MHIIPKKRSKVPAVELPARELRFHEIGINPALRSLPYEMLRKCL